MKLGINISGAEFNGRNGKEGHDYIYTGTDFLQPYIDRGINSFRYAQRIERVFPKPGEELNSYHIDKMLNIASFLKEQNCELVLNPAHNGVFYDGSILGSSGYPVDWFYEYGYKIGQAFKDVPNISINPVNEPRKTLYSTWFSFLNTWIKSFRDSGNKARIHAPAPRLSNAAQFVKYGWHDNAILLSDPLDNLSHEIHQYVNPGQSGNTGEVSEKENAYEILLTSVSDWARTNGQKLALTETNAGPYGTQDDSHAYKVLMGLCDHLIEYKDVYDGVWLWCAGKWYGEKYHFTTPPDDARLLGIIDRLMPYYTRLNYTPRKGVKEIVLVKYDGTEVRYQIGDSK